MLADSEDRDRVERRAGAAARSAAERPRTGTPSARRLAVPHEILELEVVEQVHAHGVEREHVDREGDTLGGARGGVVVAVRPSAATRRSARNGRPWGAGPPSPAGIPRSSSASAGCGRCGRAGCRRPHGTPWRRSAASRSSRNTCSPGSSQGRRVHAARRAARRGRPSRLEEVDGTGLRAVRDDRASGCRRRTTRRRRRGRRRRCAVPVVVVVDADVVLRESHGPRSDVHVGQHRHVVVGGLGHVDARLGRQRRLSVTVTPARTSRAAAATRAGVRRFSAPRSPAVVPAAPVRDSVEEVAELVRVISAPVNPGKKSYDTLSTKPVHSTLYPYFRRIGRSTMDVRAKMTSKGQVTIPTRRCATHSTFTSG